MGTPGWIMLQCWRIWKNGSGKIKRCKILSLILGLRRAARCRGEPVEVQSYVPGAGQKWQWESKSTWLNMICVLNCQNRSAGTLPKASWARKNTEGELMDQKILMEIQHVLLDHLRYRNIVSFVYVFFAVIARSIRPMLLYNIVPQTIICMLSWWAHEEISGRKGG